MGKKGKSDESQYGKLGVASDKSPVTDFFRGINRRDVPYAFCNIAIDPKTNTAFTIHPDGSGSKSIQRCLEYQEKLDKNVFIPDVFDAFGMNSGDVAASGFLGPYIACDILGINSININKFAVLGAIADGITNLIALYKKFGIEIIFFGGETADLPDQINSYVLDFIIYSQTQAKNLIRGDVQPDDHIFGFVSDGKAKWEDEKNSGQMDNGCTLSRIGLMKPEYIEKYPHLGRKDAPYRGQYDVFSYSNELGMRVSEAILSPTRQWAIVIKLLIEELKKRNALHLLHGIVQNTGGGATKIKNIGHNISYYKRMPAASPYFSLIQSETKETWENMYKTFNMGIGLDIVGDNQKGILGSAIEAVSDMSEIDYFHLGKCKRSRNGNQVFLETQYGKHYRY